MSEEKVILARLKKGGNSFEVSVDPDLAVDFKEGKISDLSEVLKSDHIFFDAKKGQLASLIELENAFGTSDQLEVAKIIITTGEIQLSSDHRSKERQQKWNQLVDTIHRFSINPLTNTPHPNSRIEAALHDAKVRLKENQTIEEQLSEIVSKLKPIIPIKIEQKTMNLTISHESVGKVNNFVRKNSKILKEDWDTEGNWKIRIEVPAGFQQEFIEKLNSMTHGTIQIENDK